jgi:hypothetical protein
MSVDALGDEEDGVRYRTNDYVRAQSYCRPARVIAVAEQESVASADQLHLDLGTTEPYYAPLYTSCLS